MRILGWRPRHGWWRWILKWTALTLFTVVLLVAGAVVMFQQPRVRSWFMLRIFQATYPDRLEEPGDARPTDDVRQRVSRTAAGLTDPGALLATTNVWPVHLQFTSNQWAALGPVRIPPLRNFLGEDFRPVVRNPAAERPGIIGVLGLHQPWSTGRVDFAGIPLQDVRIRFKGNGTFLDAIRTYRRPFKLALDEVRPGQRVAGLDELNLENVVSDASALREVLGHEFHRDAGLPAARTAFARVLLTIEGTFEERLLGLYILVEDPARGRIARLLDAPRVELFKPVTYQLFEDRGSEWAAYQEVYYPKGDVSEDGRRTILGLCRLVSHASDSEFAAGLGEWVDLPALARFLACQVLLSNLDGPLGTGQNFLVARHGGTGRLHFLPWDLDRSFGDVPFVGTARDRERLSLWHPWVGQNRFLERVFAHPGFLAAYRAELERLMATVFIPERIAARVDALGSVVRPLLEEVSADRRSQFDDALADPPVVEGAPPDLDSIRLKPFVRARAQSVRDQLDGRAEGWKPAMRF